MILDLHPRLSHDEWCGNQPSRHLRLEQPGHWTLLERGHGQLQSLKHELDVIVRIKHQIAPEICKNQRCIQR